MLGWEKTRHEQNTASSETDEPLLNDTGSDGTQDWNQPRRTFTSILWSGRYLHGGLILVYTAVYLILLSTIIKPLGSTETASSTHLPCEISPIYTSCLHEES